VNPEDVRNRRKDVDRPGAAIIDNGAMLARQLDEERNGRDVRDVVRVHGPIVLADLEADPMIRRHDEEGTVPQSCCSKSGDNAAQDAVNVSNL
jgi:hypothetical protein